MRRVLFFVFVSVLCLSCGTAHAGIAYTAPAGGWAYVYSGEGVAPDVTTALDRKWDHKDAGSGSSDAWDGSAIGAGAPGGVSALTDGATKYVRLQDTGNPTKYGFPDPSNRKLTFVHDLALDGVNGATILNDGVTLNFRLRIPTSGPLDDARPDDGSGVKAWIPQGYVIHSDGLAPIAIKQGTGGNGMIGFGLVLKSDHANLSGDGLVMNNLVGNVVVGGGDVTTDEAGTTGTLNLLSGFDVTEWHEFWVTIIDDITDVGTHTVKIWMDGNMGDPDGVFIVTAGNKDEYDFNGYLDMSLAVTGRSGSQDIDFFAYAAGASNPVPEPATIALLGFGGLALLRRKRG